MHKFIHVVFVLTSVIPTFYATKAANAPTALPLQVGTYKDMDKISGGDAMTPDHIPSGAAVVVACFLKDGNAESSLPSKLGTLYQGKDAPYKNVYQNASTIVYSTKVHQKYSLTYGRSDQKVILADAKDLQAAFNKDKAAVIDALTSKKKVSDAGESESVVVTPAAAKKAFDELDTLNKNAGYYKTKGPYPFCAK